MLLVAVAQQGEPLPRPTAAAGVGVVVGSDVVVVTIAGVLGSCSASSAVVVVVVMCDLTQITQIRSSFIKKNMKYSLKVLLLS